MTNRTEELWAALKALSPERHIPNGQPDGFKKECPAHDDAEPSLSIWREPTGEIKLKCFAGCDSDDVIEALPGDFTWRDRLPAQVREPRATSKGRTAPDVEYTWRDADGRGWVQTRRDEGGKRIRWKEKGRNAGERLYVPDGAANRDMPWLILEGAKAADAAALAGFRPVAIVSSSAIPSRERLIRHLGEGERLVRLWPDNDKAGRKAMETLAERLAGAGIAVQLLAPLEDWEPGTDIADVAFRGVSAFELHARLQRGETDDEARERVEAATAPSEERWVPRGGPPAPSTVSEQPDLLDRVVETVHERGVHGEDRAIRLIYLAATSRLLARPVNVVVKGPSAGGKSFTTESVLALFPPSSHLDFTAMSERALVYTSEPLSHRMVVIYEATGLESDIQTYIIRSLLSEGRIKYLVTVRAEEGGFEARSIEKEGPTGLITTTTATSLHAENETRMLSLTVTDDREQTAAIMLATAAGQEVPPPPKDWLQHQEWLEWYVAERRRTAPNEPIVVVPFAEALARLIPPVAVRLRRDFRTLLTLVEAHALLHARTRERDEAGRTVATLNDYGAVRDAVDEVMAEASARTVSRAIRETVEYVTTMTAAGGNGLTISAIGKALDIDQSTASRRVQAALEAGYLLDDRQHERQPAKIRVGGTPMPSGQGLLPTVDQVRGQSELPTTPSDKDAYAHASVEPSDGYARMRARSGGDRQSTVGDHRPDTLDIAEDYPRSAWDPDT